MKPIHIFQFMTNPVCGRYRLQIPAKYLSQNEGFRVTTFRQFTAEIYRALIEQADILVIQRLPFTPQLKKIVRALNELGKIVIYEIDDDLFNLPSESEYLKKAPADYSEKLKQAIRLCQAVQCSTEALAMVISKFHPEVFVLENQIDEVPEIPEEKPTDAPIKIAYAAGENHLNDWLEIKDAANRFTRECEINFEFQMIGDRKIYDSLQTEKKKYIPVLNYVDYLKFLQTVDVALMPLQDIPFNQSKSDVKFLESATAECAVLASKMVYGRTVQYNKTGLLFSDCNEFYENLQALLSNKSRIHKLGKSAREYVKSKRIMSLHVPKWEKFYGNIFSRRDEFLKKTLHKLQKTNG